MRLHNRLRRLEDKLPKPPKPDGMISLYFYPPDHPEYGVEIKVTPEEWEDAKRRYPGLHYEETV